MKCPVCNVDLVMSERQGIEIDYCPQCRGVWLDRGELDKIIERSSAQQYSAPAAAAPAAAAPVAAAAPQQQAVPQQAAPQQPAQQPQGYDDRNRWIRDSRDKYYDDRNRWMYDSKNKGYGKRYRKKKRGGFLEDLFEFGD